MTDVEKSAFEESPSKWYSRGWFGLGLRHIQFFMYFSVVFIAYGIRTNMSVGIIAMMKADDSNPEVPTFPDWTQKDTILSAFFWGYVIPQIGVGALVKKIGPKWFLCVTVFINAFFTLLIPPMAIHAGEGGVIACRVIQGFNQGFMYPSLHNLLGKWTPLAERSKVGSFVYTAGPLGTVVAMIVTGAIADSRGGWPLAFYLYGALGVAWSTLWAFIGADSPAKHGSISEEERRYIENNSEFEENEKLPTPWLKIFTSLPFLSILVAHSGQNWGFWTLMTEIPSYMDSIMKFKLSENGLLSGLPYLVLWIMSLFFGPLADFLIVRGYLSIKNVRKLFNSIGSFFPAIALIALSFVDTTNKELAITLLTLAVGFNAGIYSGFNINHIDLSPNHAGVLMGITNGLSNIFSIVAPLIVNVLPYPETDPVLWRWVFCISSGVYVASNIFYITFADGKVQSWNGAEEESK